MEVGNEVRIVEASHVYVGRIGIIADINRYNRVAVRMGVWMLYGLRMRQLQLTNPLKLKRFNAWK
jgi:hypothetical protein